MLIRKKFPIGLRSVFKNLRNGLLLGLNREIGYFRWLIRFKILRKFSSHVDTSRTGEVTYSLENFQNYTPLARIEYPLYLLRSIPNVKKDSLLIIGPRFETEFLIAMGLGWEKQNLRGLDLFSYSSFVDVGNMHSMPYENKVFDSVICSWTLSYSLDPQKLATEISRTTRSKGIVIIAVDKVKNSEIGLKGILQGNSRIQNGSSIHALFPGAKLLANFEPDTEGWTICALELP
jgi:hypothetical protein